MSSINNLRIIGNLGNNPFIKATNAGKLIVNFRVAVNSGNHDKRRTDWFTCEAIGLLAEDCSNLKVGDQVFLEGRLESREYKSRETNHEVHVLVIEKILDLSKSVMQTYQMPDYLNEIPDLLEIDSLID